MVRAANATVRTTLGRLRGVEHDDLIRFAGVPYAAPPIGERRFRAPRPHPGWEGVRAADAFGPVARQLPSPLDMALGGQPQAQDEDCLFLNIWTPGVDDERRPVLVWIHGGAFTSGSGSLPVYDGSRLARRGDVVVVTLNYRLGELGWLYLDELGAELAGSANNGLADQIAALCWVRDNIANFGGDPERVTVFGESAGAMSIAALLGAPAATGLFQRAITQSGAANAVLSVDQARAITEDTRRRLGFATTADLLDAPSADLLRSQAERAAIVLSDLDAHFVTHGAGGMSFSPVVDGVVLPSHPLDAVAAGAAAGVGLLCGTTRDEWNLFMAFDHAEPDDDVLAGFAAIAVPHAPADEVVAVYRRALGATSNRAVKAALRTDLVFRQPTIRLAEAHAAHRPEETYKYLFGWRSRAFDGRLGACHALELPFVFGCLSQQGVDLLLGPGPRPTALSERMMDAWLAFARSGDPCHPNLPEWPPYDPDRRAVLEFDEVCAVLDDPHGDIRRLWG